METCTEEEEEEEEEDDDDDDDDEDFSIPSYQTYELLRTRSHHCNR